MKSVYLIVPLILSLATLSLHAQDNGLNFGQYGNYSLTVGEISTEDLNFGSVLSESGMYSVDINNAKVVTITGIEYLDVIVEVTAQTELYLNGNPGNAGDPQKAIPFTLQAAYANNKGTPSIGQATFLNVTGNTFIKQFPILQRQNQPPGPPPTPPTNAFDQSKVEDTAYLYLYGSINVGNVDAGNYSSEITVTINYD